MKEEREVKGESAKRINRPRFEPGDEYGGSDLSLIKCVKLGYAANAKRRIEDDHADVNMQDGLGMTALHYAAAFGARQCVRVLVNSGKCNYLLKDRRGRYASELAFACGKDYAVGVLLSKKQVKQAYEQGVSTWEKTDR